MRNEFGSLVGSKVKVIADTCDGLYDDQRGKQVIVVAESEMDDDMIFLTVLTDRPTNSPYLQDNKEIIYLGDVELI